MAQRNRGTAKQHMARRAGKRSKRSVIAKP